MTNPRRALYYTIADSARGEPVSINRRPDNLPRPGVADRSRVQLRLPAVITLEFFRRRLAHVDAPAQLAGLAVLTGLLAGGVILIFRLLIESVAATWVTGGDPENFEALGMLPRILVPLGGALFIGAALNRFMPSARRVGVVHVMERLSRHQGYLPARAAWVQFFGGIIALATGQSGGREGPAIHLGAAASSFLGRAFRLPNNSMRTLVACGTAAAIAGSFNTPIAGVIFAMEVVMMEYTIASFIPVILSSVIATLLTHWAIGNEAAFAVPALQMNSLTEIPFIALVGVIVGCAAAGYIWLVRRFARLSEFPFWQRATLAGLITGLVAAAVPEVMGIGYDTVNKALLGQVGITLAVALILAKGVTSAAAVGLGLPVGLIGPTLLIGTAIGSAAGVIGGGFADGASHPGFYVMLGMSAMMAAVLQAPLAALMCVLELTANPNIILPAMLIIVVATLTTSEVFKQQSVFLTTLNTLGLQYPPSPVTLQLQKVGVAAIMNRGIARLPETIGVTEAESALEGNPRWVLVEDADGEVKTALSATDLRLFLDDKQGEIDAVHLLELPGMRKDTASIDVRATLFEAQQILRNGSAEALCVRRSSAPMIAPIVGVITQDDIDNYRDTPQ